MPNSLTVACGCSIALFLLLIAPLHAQSATASDQKGCEGVRYGQLDFAQYSPENLRRRIAKNPTDVDALINLGIRLEEQEQFAEADTLFESAIRARPECYLGYYFGGLLKERIGAGAVSEAEVRIRKALDLNPTLQDDPNVEGFYKRHPSPSNLGSSHEAKEPPATKGMSIGSTFFVGVGVGLLLSAPLLFVIRHKKRTSM